MYGLLIDSTLRVRPREYVIHVGLAWQLDHMNYKIYEPVIHISIARDLMKGSFTLQTQSTQTKTISLNTVDSMKSKLNARSEHKIPD